MPQIFDTARKKMVEGQLLPNKITTPALIDALGATPRENFVPRHLQKIAYVDEDINLGNGRYLPEPMVLARLIQAAAVGAGDIVLDIGCATGYSTALLGQMAATVIAVEADRGLAEDATRILQELDISNAAVIYHADVRAGYAQQRPYNVILINGSVPAVPADILSQLADGGRLVTVLSNRGHMGSAILITRSGGSFATRVLFDAAQPTLVGFEKTETFEF